MGHQTWAARRTRGLLPQARSGLPHFSRRSIGEQDFQLSGNAAVVHGHQAADTQAWKKLKRFIEQKFDGHDLSCLFAELLTADGYQVQVSPEGHDGDRDILAARGDFGFTGPKICVQVKRTAKPVGAPVFRELLGTMRMFGATHGILVSWSGFTQAAQREAIEKYFDVRLIDGDELLRMVLSKYGALSASMKRRLPLRRAWVFKPTDGNVVN